MLDPVVNGGFCYMEQGTNICDLIQGLVGHARRFVSRGIWFLLLGIIDLLPDNLPDGLPELFRFIREQHRGNEVTIAH